MVTFLSLNDTTNYDENQIKIGEKTLSKVKFQVAPIKKYGEL